jgi:hypothetical protein
LAQQPSVSFWIVAVLALITFGTAVTLITSSAEANDCPSALVNGVPCIGTAKLWPVLTPLESEIIGLLYLSDGDSAKGWNGERVDMLARKRFFTEEGWDQYQDYVTWHKQYLTGWEGDRKFSYHVTASLVEGSQEYTTISTNLTKFTTKGHFHYGEGDDFTAKKPMPFKIEIVYSNIKNASGILIHQWDGGLEPEMNGDSNGLPR